MTSRGLSSATGTAAAEVVGQIPVLPISRLFAAVRPRRPSETLGAAAFCLVLLWFLKPVLFPPSSAPLQANQPAARPEPAGLCRLLLGGRLAGSHQDGPLPRQLHGGGLRFPGVGGQDVHRVSRRLNQNRCLQTAIKAMLGFNGDFFSFLVFLPENVEV